MSFRCDHCRHPQPTGSRPVVIVTETRPREYCEIVRDAAGTRHRVTTGHGREIVREERRCCKCAQQEDAQ